MRLKSEAIIMLSMGASKKFAAEFVERSIETIKMGQAVERVRTGIHPHRTRRERQRLETHSGAGGGDQGGALPPPSEQGIAANFWNVPRLAGWTGQPGIPERGR